MQGQQYAVLLSDKTTFSGYVGRVLSTHRSEDAAERARTKHQRSFSGLPLAVYRLKSPYTPGEIALVSDIDRSDQVGGL